MDVNHALPLLGGLSPDQFMRRHWQRKPLLVRQAVGPDAAPLDRRALFRLAARDEVRSRLVVRKASPRPAGPAPDWSLRQGPFRRLPPLRQPAWTLLVQGVDGHIEAARRLLDAFRFVPDARLDDLMISFATDGGGVGPHFDSYDVFLLQVQGRRLWRIGRQKDMTLQPDMPLKILQQFEPEQEFLLDAGDMLYLPPRYAHDGIAVGDCMTCSIGFRSPDRGHLARELLQRLGDDAADALGGDVYRDPGQPAVAEPARIPNDLLAFAQDSVRRALAQPDVLRRALGEWLTEPQPDVWFDGGRAVSHPV
ncbi:MAG: cupin domain-containing protein, partial [Rhodoferax sp.]|nr:cupin domain-containing protein [Rhodoferax sp.]